MHSAEPGCSRGNWCVMDRERAGQQRQEKQKGKGSVDRGAKIGACLSRGIGARAHWRILGAAGCLDRGQHGCAGAQASEQGDTGRQPEFTGRPWTPAVRTLFAPCSSASCRGMSRRDNHGSPPIESVRALSGATRKTCTNGSGQETGTAEIVSPRVLRERGTCTVV